MSSDLLDQLQTGSRLIIDGGIGTEFQRRGITMHPKTWCATAHLDAPELMQDIYRSYIAAGADIITTNSFHGARHVLFEGGFAPCFDQINRLAVELAREVSDEQSLKRTWVAGSMSTVPALGYPVDLPRGETVFKNHCEQAEILAENGVDFLLCEMLMDTEASLALIEAASRTGLPVWAGLSASADSDQPGEVMAFRTPGRYSKMADESFASLVESVCESNVEVLGVMHTKLPQVPRALEVMRQFWSGPSMVYAELGTFDDEGWLFDSAESPMSYARSMAKLSKQYGIQVVGGCCGTSVLHIEAVAQATRC